MKNIRSSIMIICLLVQGAGIHAEGPIHRGILFGFNSSTFTGSDQSLENNSYLPGVTFGMYQVVDLSARFFLEQDLSFTTKGSRLRTIGDLYLHQVVTFMELPLLAGWNINPGKKTTAFLSGGPTIGLLLLAFNEVGFPEETTRVDMGAQLGIGLRWEKFRIGLHVNQGLLDLDRSSSATCVKNRTLSFTLGLFFISKYRTE
jgi:hypothetical protein